MANSYLSRTPSSAGNRRTFTLSAWIKGHNAAVVGSGYFFTADVSGGSNIDAIGITASGLQVSVNSANSGALNSTRLFRDMNAWYHIVWAVDTTQATASNRMKVYLNGEQMTDWDTETYPTQNYDFAINGTTQHNVSYRSGLVQGYMSHVAFVDGTALTPTSFGETDSTSGIWKFKSPSGLSWGTNGFHLKFENSGNLGLDSSGQTNNYTVNGDLKQSLSTPSNVYATLNGTFNLSDNVLSYGSNKALNSNSNWKYVPATLGVESGKWYAEYKVNKSSGYIMNGVVDMAYATSQDKNSYTHSGAGTGSVSIYSDSGEKYIAGSNTTYAGTYTTNDIIGVALDMDNSKVYFSKNGAWANGSGGWGSSTFDAAVGAITLPTTGTYTFAVSQRSGAYNEVNFGNGFFGITAISSAGSNGNGSLFEYDVPSGFYALNTKNINTYG